MIDPFIRFTQLLESAARADIAEPTAMTLATADARGRPSARMVLLKGVDEAGFVFYTNRESRKARDLAENPWAALCFHWHPIESQVRVEGFVREVDAAEADAYFATRPRGSQIGAWASLQSQPLRRYRDLEDRVEELYARFGDGAIPRPPYWSGYRLTPERLEFWSGRPSRLHEREVYSRGPSGEWVVELLYP
jgi:pyridoxamine 5'-phosphate oxidase